MSKPKTPTPKYDYAYSVGLIRTLETLLLNENEVDRMILAPNAKEAFRILNEFDYADNKLGIEDPSEFQKVITEGLMDIKEELTKVTPDKRILNILWHFYDFHNIKTLLKAKLGGKEYEEVEGMLNGMGAIPHIALKQFIFDKENSVQFKLDDEETENYIKAKIRKAEKEFEKHQNPQIIDLYIDQKMMKIIFQVAEYSKNEFLITFVRKLIDLSNIKLFFRMKTQEKELELYEIAFIRNGVIPFTKFKDAYAKGVADLPEEMKATHYANLIAEGYKEYEESHTFLHLEKMCEDHLTDYIKSAKLIPFGPEPLIAYFLAKRNNALIIRMILVSKLNQVDPEEIRKRLRKLYS